MIWTAWFSLSVILAVLAQGDRRAALAIIAACLVALWVAKLGLQPEPFWIFAALIWIVVGLAISALSGGVLAVPALLLVASGIAVMIGRFFGGEYAFGNIYLALSDALGVAALIWLGAPGVLEFVRSVLAGVGRLGSGG